MLFEKADKAMEKLGFDKIEENEYGVSYRKEIKKYGFTHRLDIGHKEDGNHLIQSYVEGINSEGFNNCVGITYPETKAVMKKYRELKRKYRW